ncbi:MAG: hypothetical protein HYS26_01820 [Candidatus Kaiserbacteria bacterium]|nr:MAG: hypothetical protein HYS26_01820 [Candidatus Kaiserbacteria bacterium]
MSKTVLALGGALVVLAALWYLYAATPGPENTNTSGTSSGLLAEENAIVIGEQRPGTSVRGSIVYLAAPGFFVIHEDQSGQVGAMLGASALLPAGENRDVAVNLSRTSRDGETLRAVLHSDTNGNGLFDEADQPVESRLGGPINGWFEISSEASTDTPVSI